MTKQLQNVVNEVLSDPGVVHLSEQTIANLRAAQKPISELDLNIKFDDSVSPEKALKFLVTLGEKIDEAGGTLCLRKRKEKE